MGRLPYETSNRGEVQKIEEGIVNIEGFEKDQKQKQRFIYLNYFHLDIIPFGEVMKENDKIYWPPEEEVALSVLGFSEVNKDADDMAFIINNYYTINEQRAIEDHYDLFEVEDFDIQLAGARLLGRDIAKLLSNYNSTKSKLVEILASEAGKGEESRLINQILDTHKSFNYDNIYECLVNILKGLED